MCSLFEYNQKENDLHWEKMKEKGDWEMREFWDWEQPLTLLAAKRV